MMAGFLVFGLLFVFRQSRVEHALVEMRLFSNAALKVCLANQVTVYFSTAGSMILLSFFFQEVLGFDIGRAGMMLAVIPIVMAVVSPLSGWLCDRVGAWPVIMAGQSALLISYVGFSVISDRAGAWELLPRLVILGAGIALFMTPNNKVIMGTASKKDLGLVSGLLTLSRSVGQVVGVGGMGALWAFYIGYYDAGNATLSSVKAQAFETTFAWVAVLSGLSLTVSMYTGKHATPASRIDLSIVPTES